MSQGDKAARDMELLERRGPIVRRRIEAGALVKYARAIGESNPLYMDEDAARLGPYGVLIAPPAYVGTVGNEAFEGIFPPAPEFSMFLHTGDAVVHHEPIRAGDLIEAQAVLTSRTMKEGRHGPMLLQTGAMTLTNQHGRRVATVEMGMASFNPAAVHD
jgi:acyl dehydratase